MLILTRRPGEEILIDKGQIVIKVLHARGRQVALGIQSARHIDIERKEIFIKKMEAKALTESMNQPMREEA